MTVGRADGLPADLPTACLNCGAALVGPFCHQCGQQREHGVLPLRRVVAEVVEDALSLDGRLFRTLRALLARPGRLTEEYLAGRRAAFLPPFRLYLIASIAYFAVLSLTGSHSFLFFTADQDSEQAARFIRLMPRLMFVILPAFALVLKALHPRRLYTEHLVFALHFHALAFLLLSLHTPLKAFAAGQLAPAAPRPVAVAAAVAVAALELAFFVYLFRALRRVYGGRWWAAGARLLFLLGGYLGILIVTGAAIIRAAGLLAGRG